MRSSPVPDPGIEADDPDLDNSIIQIQTGQMEGLEAGVVRSSARLATSTISNVDPFANINQCTPEQIERLAKILEIRGAQPRQEKMRKACFQAAGLRPGMRILELGCGTGVVARELSRLVGRDGRVVAIDASEGLLRYA